MRMRIIAAGALACCLLLTACASLTIGSSQYPQAQFGAFHTYAWISNDPLIRADGDATPISALTLRRIREAIEEGLAAKGYRQVPAATAADFVVAFTVGSRDRIDAQSYPVPYRGPWLWGWRGRETDLQVYREGTLSIDIFDGASHQPVWNGWASKVITSSDVSDPGPVIHQAVTGILRKFPSR